VTSAARPLRRDAQRNRSLILDAARDAFRERGLDVTLDEIADRACVGVGTVYRRFADRDALIDALFEDGLRPVIAQAEEALGCEDSWRGFVQWFEALVEIQIEDRGLAEVLYSSERVCEHVVHVREELAPLQTRIVKRAQAAGQLRPDVRLSDIVLLARMLADLGYTTREVAPGAYRRQLAVVLDGLRDRDKGMSRVPGRPLTRDELWSLRRDAKRLAARRTDR
jgi:AcrR family transcriptional regulator